MKKLLKIENLHCAACALELEEELAKIEGVEEVHVDFVTQSISIDVNEEGLARAIKSTNKFEKVKVIDSDGYEPKKKQTYRKEILFIALSAVCFAFGFLIDCIFEGALWKAVGYALYAVAYLSVGYPVLISTAKNCVKGKIFDENFLMTVASIGAVFLGQYDEAVLVMLLYQTGELLQTIAVGASRDSLTELMSLKSERAYLSTNEGWTEVRPEELQVGDVVLVKSGEKIPADGCLVKGSATLDMKALTGESELCSVCEGGELLSGSVNVGSAFEMQIKKPYAESAVSKILDLVENASAKKAAPEKFISRFAKYYTPIVCVLALIIAVCVPPLVGLATEGKFFYKDFPRYLQSALTFLVISCPCALIISVPLTYFSGIGACAKRGILVKGATYLDEMARAKTVVFDKTGTLTYGDFTVRAIFAADGVEETELLETVAALEKSSAHPIAKSFEKVEILPCEKVTEIAGRGLQAVYNGAKILVGTKEFLEENGVTVVENDSTYTLVYAARNKEFLGVIELGDRVREEAKNTIVALKEQGIERVVMLTGDRLFRAERVANEVGVDEINAELLPDEKLTKAEQLKKSGRLVYVGDGINDAPVMKAADCAVSMGKLGSAAAVEASDLVLISDRLDGVSDCRKIALKTRKIVTENIVFSIVMKTSFMILGGLGVLPLWLAVFADVGVMLIAVLNSMRMRLPIK